MATHNFFALLGDNENEDPAAAALIASASSALQNSQSKKAQLPAPARAQHSPATLPSKPPPPSEFVREARRSQVRGGRGSWQGGRGGFGQTDGDRMDIISRGGGENGYLGGRASYQRGRGGYGGSGRGGSFGGYAEAVDVQDKEGEGGYNKSEGDRARGGRGQIRDQRFTREGNDQSRVGEYDRQSASGRGYEVKRGVGRGNWGVGADQEPPKDEMFEVGSLKEEEYKSHSKKKDEEQPKDGILVKDESPKEQEQEEKEMTLDEYEKVLEERKRSLSALKSQERKVNADKSFQAMQLVDRKADKEYQFIKLGIDKEKGKKKEVAAKEDKAKKAVSINEFLKPANGENYNGGRGRGRGRGRGSGSFSGGFNTSHRVSAPQIEDPGQFPTLGGN